jgi:hypothetical protein
MGEKVGLRERKGVLLSSGERERDRAAAFRRPLALARGVFFASVLPAVVARPPLRARPLAAGPGATGGGVRVSSSFSSWYPRIFLPRPVRTGVFLRPASLEAAAAFLDLGLDGRLLVL